MVDQNEADRVIASAYAGWVEPRASPTNPTWRGSPGARPTLTVTPATVFGQSLTMSLISKDGKVVQPIKQHQCE